MLHLVLHGIQNAAVSGHDDLAAGNLLDGCLQHLLLILVSLHISVREGLTLSGEVQSWFSFQVVPALRIRAVVNGRREFVIRINIDAVDGVDQVDQHGEVDRDAVVDIDIEEILDGLLCFFFPVYTRMRQLVLCTIGMKRHIAVARNGGQEYVFRLRVHGHDHVDVAESRLVRLELAPDVLAGDEHIERIHRHIDSLGAVIRPLPDLDLVDALRAVLKALDLPLQRPVLGVGRHDDGVVFITLLRDELPAQTDQIAVLLEGNVLLCNQSLLGFRQLLGFDTQHVDFLSVDVFDDVVLTAFERDHIVDLPGRPVLADLLHGVIGAVDVIIAHKQYVHHEHQKNERRQSHAAALFLAFHHHQNQNVQNDEDPDNGHGVAGRKDIQCQHQCQEKEFRKQTDEQYHAKAC